MSKYENILVNYADKVKVTDIDFLESFKEEMSKDQKLTDEDILLFDMAMGKYDDAESALKRLDEITKKNEK